MVGQAVKRLREERSWSQAHLAQAACVNIRTIQRLEAGEPCSSETMLSIAAALDVNLRDLPDPTGREAANSGLAEARLSRRDRRPSRTTFVAAAICAPCVIFVAVNLLKFELGIVQPYDALAQAGSSLISLRAFNLLSPLVFVGGTLTAFALCVRNQIALRAKNLEGVVSIEGIQLRARAADLAVMVLAALGGGGILLYAAAENLGRALN